MYVCGYYYDNGPAARESGYYRHLRDNATICRRKGHASFIPRRTECIIYTKRTENRRKNNNNDDKKKKSKRKN